MKATGITRMLDGLGRVVIPKEIRRTLDIKELDKMEIFIDGEDIILRKYKRGCTICGGLDGLKPFMGKEVCQVCRDGLRQALSEGKRLP